MDGWEVAQRGLELSWQMAALSWSPIAFRGCRSSTLSSQSFMAPNLQPPTCQPPSLTNSSLQAGPLGHSQVTPVTAAPFPPAVSPAGDYVSNVCLYHRTVSPPTGGASSMSLL